MAILKSSVVQGSMRVTDTTYTNDLIISDTTAPTITTGDYLLLADTSEGNKVLKGPDLNTSNTTKWLTQAGTWTTPTASNVGLGNVSNNANLNSTTGAKGDIVYWSAANTPTHLTNTSSTTKNFLSITSQVPAWTTLSKSDVGLGDVENVKLSTWTGSANLATLKGLTLEGSAAASYIASFAGTTDASAITTAAVKIAGGLGVSKQVRIGGMLTTSTFVHPTLTGSGTAGVTYVAASGSTAAVNGKPALWKFNLSTATPTEGDVITIKIPVAGHDSGVFISTDNGTTYYPVSVNGTGRLTTHYAQNQIISLAFLNSGGTNDVYPVAGATARTNISGNHWVVLNYYDANTTPYGIRVYNQTSGYNADYPLIVSRTALSTQIGTLDSNSSYSNNIYGVIWDSPNSGTHNKTPTLNPNTGMMKFLSATIQGTTPSSSKTTGALIVKGGVGVAGTVYANEFNGPLTGNATNVTGTVAIGHGGTDATTAAEARTNLNAATGNGRIFYGTCATAAATGTKVVVCPQYDELTVGDIIIVTFTNNNTYDNFTIKIQDKASSPTVTTATKEIRQQVNDLYYSTLATYFVANKPYMFIYDGTYWILININTQNLQINETNTTFSNFSSFEDRVIALAQLYEGRMTSMAFILPRPTTSNGFSSTNLRFDALTSKYYTGFLTLGSKQTISNIPYIEGSLIFWDKYNNGSYVVDTSNNKPGWFSEDVYLWQFVATLSSSYSTQSVTWTFNKIKNKKWGKAGADDEWTINLYPDSWTGTGPYYMTGSHSISTGTIEQASYSPDVDYIVGLSKNSTAEEYEAACAAELFVNDISSNSAGQITLQITAFGEKPEVKLELEIIAVVR